MGFSGQFVFGRSDGSLLDAPALDAVRPLAEWESGAVHELWPRPGGWQTLQFGDERGSADVELLRALVAWSGAPACVASVFDSDVADVVGMAPGGREWRAELNIDVVAGHIPMPGHVDDELDWIGSPEYAEAVAHKRRELEAAVAGSAQGALAWAAAAGFGAAGSQAAVEELLRSHSVFVEDLFVDLLDMLGFPPPVEPAEPAGPVSG